jgi:hypothetical protein
MATVEGNFPEHLFHKCHLCGSLAHAAPSMRPRKAQELRGCIYSLHLDFEALTKGLENVRVEVREMQKQKLMEQVDAEMLITTPPLNLRDKIQNHLSWWRNDLNYKAPEQVDREYAYGIVNSIDDILKAHDDE